MARESQASRAKNLRMIKNCQACNHPEVAKINALLLKNEKYTVIVKRFHLEITPLSTKSLSNHNRRSHAGLTSRQEVEKMAKDGQITLRSSLHEMNKNFQDIDQMLEEVLNLEIDASNFAEQRVKYELLHKYYKLRNDMIKTNQGLLDGEDLTEVANQKKDIAEFMAINKKDDIKIAN